MNPKPAHLGPEFGSQFADRSVAESYKTRNPYPPALFETLLQLSIGVPNPILDLGCGTGDIALELASRTSKLVYGVDPSGAMLEVARSRDVRESASNVRWFHDSAETFEFEGPFSLVVAGESLHWMEWDVVVPKIASWLSRGAHLVVVDGREFKDPPWKADLLSLLPKYSTNQQFRAYDLIEELTSRGLFHEVGRETIIGGCVSQSVDDYIESFHTRNGFSRERMAPDQAKAFDDAVRSFLGPFEKERMVSDVTTTRVVWGLPVSA